MKAFNWENFKHDNVAVQCKTEEEAKCFCKMMDEHGLTWCDGNSYIDMPTYWNEHRKKIYYTGHGTFEYSDDYLSCCLTILDFSDYFTVGCNYDMRGTKDELETGMLVETRNGHILTVLRGINTLYTGQKDVLLNHSESIWTDLSDYTDNLLIDKRKLNCYDIMKIYLPFHPYCTQDPKHDLDKAQLLWERDEGEEREEMTLSQVEELLGKKIKIILEEEEVKICHKKCEEQKIQEEVKHCKVDDKILVSDDGVTWFQRHFWLHYVRNDGTDSVMTFPKGRTSWSSDDISDFGEWKYAKLPEGSKPNSGYDGYCLI